MSCATLIMAALCSPDSRAGGEHDLARFGRGAPIPRSSCSSWTVETTQPARKLRADSAHARPYHGSQHNIPEPPRGVAGHRCACEQCTGASAQKLGAHRRFVFHVLTWTPRLAPFAWSTAAILWEDGPEGSQTHSQRAGAGPPDAAQVVPQLRGVTNGSPFFQGPQFCTL